MPLKTKTKFYFWVVILLLGCLYIISCAQAGDQLKTTHYFKMDTYLRLLTPPLQGKQLETIQEELTRLDQLLNRFTQESDLGRVNQQAGSWVNVAEDTIILLTEAKRISEKTGGAFDPTIGPLAELWGISMPTGMQTDERGWRPPSSGLIEEKCNLINYNYLKINSQGGQVQLEKAGMSLDVGGVAKGYAVDYLAKLLRSWGISQGLIDFGGDIYALGQHPQGRPWQLGISNPKQPDEIFATLAVVDRAIATSGDYQRFRVFEEKRYSHLLDPRTGFPAEELASVTIVAENGVIADALATAVFVLGWEQGRQLIEEWPGVEALLIAEDLNFWVSDGLKGQISFQGLNNTI